MKKVKIACLLGLMALATTSVFGQGIDPSYSGYYELQTQFRGDKEVLEGNGSESKYMNGAAFMSKQKGASGTHWKFVPEPGKAGYYRLKNQNFGDKQCLEGNEMAGKVKNGAALMRNCENVSGQLWKIEDAGNGYYRLRTMFQGNNHFLEGNEAGGKEKGGNAFMNTSQNVSGQMWKFVKI